MKWKEQNYFPGHNLFLWIEPATERTYFTHFSEKVVVSRRMTWTDLEARQIAWNLI